MTEETEKLFDAPWRVVNHMHVITPNGDPVCVTCDEKHANRLASLPELYDALMEAAKEYCKGADLGCPDKRCALAMDHMCKAMPWIELLRKVRDGK